MLVNPGNCAQTPSCPSSGVGPPGQTGPAGTPGINGANGINAVTNTTGNFNQPYPDVTISGTRTAGSAVITGLSNTSSLTAGMAVSGPGIPNGATILTIDSPTQITMTVNATNSGTSPYLFTNHITVAVASSAWASVGMNVFIDGGGYYRVVAVPNASQIKVRNLAVSGINAGIGTLISTGRLVTPTGYEGPASAITSVGLAAPSIFSVTGSPLTTAGTITIGLVSQAPLTTSGPGIVFASPATGTGGAPSFRALVPSDIPNLDAGKITTGILPIARGGTNGATQQAAINNLSGFLAKGDLLARDANNAVRFPVGTNGQVLVANSNATVGMNWADVPFRYNKPRRTVTASPDVLDDVDYYVGVNLTTAGPVTLTLPANPVDGMHIIIKDEKLDAATNNITILANTGHTLESGAGISPINVNGGRRHLVFNSGNNTWYRVD